MTRSLISILVLAASPAFSADLQGTVTAVAGGGPIIDARVVGRGAGPERWVTTDLQGVYHFTGLESSDHFSIEVTAPGFRPFLQEDIRISSDLEKLDVRLQLANVLESIIVKGSAEVISLVSNSPDVSQTITTSELEQLPSYQRNVVKYSLLDPHVRQTQGLGGDGNDSNRLSINAASYRQTAYILDGVINYDWIYANGPYQLVAASAVEEMRVITNQYAAEYGTSTSGVIKVSTRSGTSDLNGEAFAFLRPSGIQAAPPLTPYHVPNERAQWGALAGGPVIKQKTFFFASYEGINQHRGAFIQSPIPGFFTGEAHEIYGLTRLDHNFTENHAVSVRINAYHYRNTNANDRISGFNQPSFGRMERSQSWGGQITDRLVIGGVLNYVRVNYSSFRPDNNGPSGAFTSSVGINRPNYSVEGFSTFNWAHPQLIDLSDMVAFNRGRHSLKFGVEGVRVTVQDYNSPLYGTYNFPAGPPTPGQNPNNYAQTFGIANIRYGETNFQAFAQDDFKISPRLSANLGLRYEYQSVTNALHNLGPRAGLAWGTQDGRTRIVAGAGVFFDQLYLNIYRQFYFRAPNGPQKSYTIPFGVPGFPTFPNSLTEPPTSVATARIDLYLMSPKMLNPYSMQFSIGAERDLGNRLALTMNLIHAHTLKQYRVNDINHPAPFIRTAPGQIRSGAAADATRPFTTYLGVPVRDITVIENSSSSIYDALDFGIRRKVGFRLRMEAHYVVSSSATYSMFYSDFNSGIPNEWNNWGSAERAPSDFFQHHRFVGSAALELPYKMRLGVVTTIASGLPVNPLTGTDNNGDSYASDRPVGLGRNSFRTPLQSDVDVSLSKQMPVGERLRVEGRFECFNLFNHNNYININSTYGEGPVPRATFLAPIAGIRNADPSRQIQFALRFLFGRKTI